jgi:hypothetical protein
MASIPILNQQIGPGLGSVSSLPQNRTGGMGGRTLANIGDQAEEFLTKIAEQDAAVEGLNRLASFKTAQTQRLEQLQQSVKTPDGFTPLALKDFDEVSKEFLGGIENKRVARFIETRMPELRAGVAGSAVQWETNSRQALRVQNFTDGLNKYATTVQSDMASYPGARNDLLAAIEQGGFDPVEAAKLKSTGLKSLARSAVFGEIERNPQSIIDRLNKGEFPDLEADTRLQAMSAAQNEVKRQANDLKAEQQLQRQEKLVTIDFWMRDDAASRRATGKPVPLPDNITDEDLAGLLSPAGIARLRDGQALADSVFQATGEMKTQTIQEMNQTVEALNPVGGKGGFLANQEVHNEAKKQMDDQLSIRAADPGRYARESFPRVQEAWQAYEQSQDPKDLQAAMTASLNAQASVGIPAAARKPLPVSFARSVAQQVTGEPPEKAYQVMRDWAKRFGPMWAQVLPQMAKDLPTAYKVAATISDPINASILIQNSRQPIEALRKTAGAAMAKDITDQIAKNEDVKSLGQAFGLAGASLKKDVMDAVETLALGRHVTMGDGDPVGSAVKAIIKDRYSFGTVNSKPFAVGGKYKARVNEIEDAATIAIEQLPLDALNLPALEPGVSADMQRKSYANSLKRNAYWVTSEGMTGLTLIASPTRPVPVMANGKPVTYTWDELLKIKEDAPTWRPYIGYGGKGGPMDAVATSGGGKVEYPAVGSYLENLQEGDIYEDPRVGTLIKRGDKMVRYEPREAERVVDPNAMTEAEFLSGKAEDTRVQAPTREEVSRFLVQKGREAPKWEGDYKTVPRWLKDIEAQRRQGNYGRSGIDPRAEEQIAAIQAEYDQADAAYKKRLRNTPVIKELVKLGMLK